MKVMIERDWVRNPYLRELKHGLRELGVEVLERAWIPFPRAVDVVHLHSEPCHWLMNSRFVTLLKLSRFCLLVAICRWMGIPITYTLHDTHPSSAAFRGWRRWVFFAVRRWFLSQTDGVIVHSRSSIAEIQAELKPDLPVLHIGHPLYRRAAGFSERSLRKRLEIPPTATVFLLFGDFRAHKDPEWFLRNYAAHARRNVDNSHLLVAGMTPSKVARELREMRNIHFLDSFVPEDQLSDLFQATDWVLLPYNEVTCSGVIHLAATYGVPVLATDLPYFREIAGSSGALFFQRECESLGNALQTALVMEAERRAAMAKSLQECVAHVSWEQLADGCRTLYTRVLQARQSAS